MWEWRLKVILVGLVIRVIDIFLWERAWRRWVRREAVGV